MLIDAHGHPNYHGYGAERIVRNLDEQGIDKMWLLSWEIPSSEYDALHNQSLMSAVAQSGIDLADVLEVGKHAPDRFVLGYAPHPKRPDAIDRIKAATEIYPIRLAGEYKSRTLFDDPDALRLLQTFGELHLPVTIHLEYGTKYDGANYPWPDWWYGGTIGALERAVVECPDTIFIGHGPGWWSHISGDDLFDKEMYPTAPAVPGGKNPEMLAQYPNMYADLSAGSGLNALKRIKDSGRQYIMDNADKLLWARDNWDTDIFDHISALDLPTEVYEKITYQNAQKLVGEID